jgi:hypothetical protein
MPTKRVAPKPTASTASSPHLVNAFLVGLALCAGVATLFSRGRVSWPPTQFLASLFTMAGFLAMIGPILLFRRESSEVGLGDLLWMTGGLLVWVFDLAAVGRGEFRAISWATPLGYQPMGLTILVVILAAWKCRIAQSGWSWTNITGWSLGLFWVAMAAYTLVPSRLLGVAMR